MLKQPDHVVLNDFKQQRAAALDPALISQYEELVTEWMNTIEAVLTDTSDERYGTQLLTYEPRSGKTGLNILG
ncbi:hypothetical protein DPMN_055642 [Dreissena polymorpha]|uniref:Uncharacterized protein n=1 Tax=Dreissena polymorpha TaxID=45954 RepID=A0A9D4CQB5_DREPO|nr:hypothetical protein DPMN_055642 [Dreissena polymorpha]